MKTKITKRTVDAAKPDTRDLFIWDTEVPGFGLKITPPGRRVFLLQYAAGGRTRRVTLGRYGADLTVDEARERARKLRGQVKEGSDPATEVARAKKVPALRAFSEDYLAKHAAKKKKPRSYEADETNLRKHILPKLGHLRIDKITRADVARLHSSMHAIPVQANRCLALLSKMFNLSEAWGLRPDGTNPTRHIEKFPELTVERFLSDLELARLGTVLQEAAAAGEHPSVVAAIRLLIFTGCRRNEVLMLRWESVDLERGYLNLPDSKTGTKTLPLGASAVELLASLERINGNPFVLPGKIRNQHYVGLEKAWGRLRARAGLSDVRLHDLRHTHASVGASAGLSLPVIGKLLGHKHSATTQRYAHFSADPVKAAADRCHFRKLRFQKLPQFPRGRSGLYR